MATITKTTNSKPFPLSAFPMTIRQFIKEGSESLDCPRSYVALPLLAALASAIGNKRVIRLKGGYTEPAVIWGAIIGDSGGLKTPSQSLAISYLNEIQKQARKNGDPKTFIARDATFAGLRNALMQGDGSLLVTPDELITVLSSLGKGGQSQATKGHWLSCWSGSSIDILRAGTKQTLIHIPNPTVSLVGGIQPTTFKESILKEKSLQDGLCARFLVTYHEQRWPSLLTIQEVSQATLNSRDQVFQNLFSLAPDPTTGEPIPIDISGATIKPYYMFVKSYQRHAFRSSTELGAAYNKLNAYVARIALIFQLVMWASKPAANRKPDAQGLKITFQAMLGAIKVVDWFKQEAIKVYALLNEDPLDSKRRELVDLIQRNGGTITARQLIRRSSQFKKMDKANAALADLVKEGYGKFKTDQPTAAGGRPATRLQLI